MNLTVNGKNIEFEGKTLAELLVKLGFTDGGYAVAIGSQIVPRKDLNTHSLQEGNVITIIVATHGG